MDVNGDEDLIDFKVISSHPDPFMRQPVEAVKIQDTLEKGELRVGRRL